MLRMDNFKVDVTNMMLRCVLYSAGRGYEQVAGPCEHENEISRSVKASCAQTQHISLRHRMFQWIASDNSYYKRSAHGKLMSSRILRLVHAVRRFGRSLLSPSFGRTSL
jgi:hypothetical protein